MWRFLRWLLILLVVAALGAGAVVRHYHQQAHTPYRAFEGDEQFVDIPQGEGSRQIGARLIAAGIVRDDLTFRVALAITGEARALKAGEYQFTEPQSAVDVIHRLARGDVYTRALTFREGLTAAEMARHFEQSGFGTAGSFTEAVRNASLIADLDPEARDLEGYLFPNTYALPRTATADDLVRRMVALFRAAFDEALRADAARQGFSVRDVVALASLIEKETGLEAERPVVAAVYRNRLRIGMGMQADPTVIYALMLAGRWDGNITRADLQFDSPYNTYRYRGLPPGPIANPGRASLVAALNPADVDYLYFVSRNDGSHVFSRTLAEHNRAVREWQIEYFRNRRHQPR
ncbi:MAG: endolytic transglycosylase MltG [Vicinamibacterales bacterium]|nr:endolytic transglycosylase MltG [Vicinamibacterales bacterium]